MVHLQLAKANQAFAHYQVFPWTADPSLPKEHGDLRAAEAALGAAMAAAEGLGWNREFELHTDLAHAMYARLMTTEVTDVSTTPTSLSTFKVDQLKGKQIDRYEALLRGARREAQLGVDRGPRAPDSLAGLSMAYAKAFHELGVVLTACAGINLDATFQDALRAFEEAIQVEPNDALSINKAQMLHMNMELLTERAITSTNILNENRSVPDANGEISTGRAEAAEEPSTSQQSSAPAPNEPGKQGCTLL
uniref:Uncharacterized protein n=2 Tax=Pyramimonas obovata TaxID=1411642 RepID=A0A7S0WXV6_9CHLO